MKSRNAGIRNFLDYRQFLIDELQNRQKRNPAYSLRAFSRDLGIGSSRLSEIINGKVGVSEERAVNIAQRLQLPEVERALFVDLVQSEHARSNIARQAAQARLQARSLGSKKIETDEFAFISEWYNLAMLELLYIDGLEHSVEVFAETLGIDTESVEEALEGLLRLGYITRQGDRWIPSEEAMIINEENPSIVQYYHGQILDKAKEALQESKEKRDFTFAVFALNSEQVEYAKARIREFRRSLVTELEEIPGKNGVYCLSLQLFELTEKKVENKAEL